MSAEDTRYDDTLFTLAQQSGGVQELLDNVTSFLRRHTSFFTQTPNGAWEAQLLKAFHKEQEELSKQIEYKKSNEKPVNNDVDDDDDEQVIGIENVQPNEGNGCNLPKYTWTQTLNEIELKIPFECSQGEPLHARDFNIEISKKFIRVGLKGEAPLVSGELFKEVKSNESTWMLDDKNFVNITLEKVNKNLWWDRLLLSDPAISLKHMEPKKVKLSDLEANKREVVEKMLKNHNQKQMGQPIDEMDEDKRKFFEKFKAAHPELNFSKCKFGG